MPAAEYEHRSDSVLAWKKAQKLGRFDPEAPSIEQQKIRASEREVEERGKRCLFLPVSACQVVRLWQREQQKQNQIVAEHARVYAALPGWRHRHATPNCFKQIPKMETRNASKLWKSVPCFS